MSNLLDLITPDQMAEIDDAALSVTMHELLDGPASLYQRMVAYNLIIECVNASKPLPADIRFKPACYWGQFTVESDPEDVLHAIVDRKDILREEFLRKRLIGLMAEVNQAAETGQFPA